MKNSEELPEELIELILLNLPCKSLVRFKSVSRRWKDLISQPSFIHRQYSNNKLHDNSSSSSFIVARSRLGSENIRYFSQLSLSNTDGKITTSHVESFTIPSTMRDSLASTLIYSAGFGVYCLYDLGTRKLYLWNPTIRELKVLPSLTEDGRYVYGFAHIEYINNNFYYKVGMMRHPYGVFDYDLNIVVYSSSDNVWKPSRHSGGLLRSGDILSGSAWQHSGIVLNGKYHFLNWVSEEDVHIISFDLSSESFERLEIPNPLPADSKAVYSILTSVDDKFLSLVTYLGKYDELQSMEVWIMYEYGKAESWRKVSTSGPIRDPAFVEFLGVNNQIRGIFFESSDYGDGLFFCGYGSEKPETVLPVKSQDLERLSVIEYRESLISFGGISDQRMKFLG